MIYIIELRSGSKFEVQYRNDDAGITLDQIMESVEFDSVFGEQMKHWNGIRILRSEVAAYYPEDRLEKSYERGEEMTSSNDESKSMPYGWTTNDRN